MMIENLFVIARETTLCARKAMRLVAVLGAVMNAKVTREFEPLFAIGTCEWLRIRVLFKMKLHP